MKWNEMEWEWNGTKWGKMEQMEWNEMEWNEMEWNEMGWNGTKRERMTQNGMDWNGMKWTEIRWRWMKWCALMRSRATAIRHGTKHRRTDDSLRQRWTMDYDEWTWQYSKQQHLKSSAPRGRLPAVLQSYSGGEEATKKLLAGWRSRACCARAVSTADRWPAEIACRSATLTSSATMDIRRIDRLQRSAVLPSQSTLST